MAAGKLPHVCLAVSKGIAQDQLSGLGVVAEGGAGGEQSLPRSVIQAAVLTVSDRCSAGVTLDTAGPAVAVLLRDKLDARVAWTKIVPDEVEQIAAALVDFCDRLVDLVLTVGGTGISPRDVTPEATRKVIERELPGLAEAMRAASATRTPNALLSRAVAGVRGQTLVVNLPGSLRAATENLDVLLAVLPHAVKMLRNESAHPESDRGRLIVKPADAASTNSGH
jgi:molybdenum cofactor synthesis domain-containing protein